MSGAHDLPSWSVMGGAPNKGVGLGVQEGTWAQRGALKSPVKPGGLSPWGREPPPLPERGAPGCLSVLLSCPDTPLCDVGDGAHWSPGKNLFPAVPPKHRVPQGLAPSAPCLSQPPGGTLQFALICPDRGPRGGWEGDLLYRDTPGIRAPSATLLMAVVQPERTRGTGRGEGTWTGTHTPPEHSFAEGVY